MEILLWQNVRVFKIRNGLVKKNIVKYFLYYSALYLNKFLMLQKGFKLFISITKYFYKNLFRNLRYYVFALNLIFGVFSAYADVIYITNKSFGQDGWIVVTNWVTGKSIGDTNQNVMQVGSGANSATYNKKQFFGYIGFNLNPIKGVKVTSATLYVCRSNFSGTQSDISNKIIVDHVDFGPTIDISDANPTKYYTNLFILPTGNTPAILWWTNDVTSAVAFSATNKKLWSRENSSNWVQFRYRPYATVFDDTTMDYQRIFTSEHSLYKPYLKIVYTPHISITKYDISAYNFWAKQTNQTVMAFKIKDIETGHTLTRVIIKNAGNMVQGTDISNVKLWRDNNSDNWWDGNDTLIGNLYWSSSKSAWTNDNISGNWTNYIVTINIASGAVAGRNFKGIIPVGGIKCSGLYTNEKAYTNANFQTVVAPPEVAVTKNGNIPAYDLFRYDSNKTVIAFNVTDSSNHLLKSVKITNLGTMSNAKDIKQRGVKLWWDNGTTPNLWDASDTFITNLIPVRPTCWSNRVNFNQPLGGSGKNFVITIDLTNIARIGMTFKCRIPANGISCTNNKKGPTDNLDNANFQTVAREAVINEIMWMGSEKSIADEWV